MDKREVLGNVVYDSVFYLLQRIKLRAYKRERVESQALEILSKVRNARKKLFLIFPDLNE